MFRLISLLVVVAIMAILWVTVFDSTMNPSCVTGGPTTTLSPELVAKLPKGVAGALSC